MKSNLYLRKIRNFLCFFICSFHLNCPTTEEQKCIPACHLGVYLCRGDIRVTENLANALYWHTILQC